MTKLVNRDMLTVMVILGLGVLAMSVLGPILPLYLTSMGAAPEIVGAMLAILMMGTAAGEGLWGWVADRVGVKIPLSIGTFVCALLVPFFVLTQNLLFLAAMLFSWGLVRSAIAGPARGYIGANARSLRKATSMAIVGVMLSASTTAGTLPSGFIVDTLGYGWIFFISSGISLLAGVLVVTGLRKTRPGKLERPTVSSFPTDELSPLGQVSSYPPFISQCAVTALYFVGRGVLGTFLPLLATQVVGVKPTEVGILFAIRGVAVLVLSIPMGILADRKGERVLMVLGLLVSAFAMAGLGFAGSFPLLIVFVILNSLGFAMFSPAALGLVSNSVPFAKQCTAMGFYGGACEDTGVIIGSAVGGFVWSVWGAQAAFLMGTFTSVLGAVICSSRRWSR